MLKRKTLAIGFTTAGLCVVGLLGLGIWSSQVFAGGSKIAGVDVSFLTPAAAEKKLGEELSARSVSFSSGSASGEIPGKELATGISYEAVVDSDFSSGSFIQHPFGRESNRLSGLSQEPKVLETAIYSADTNNQIEPVEATIDYDAGSYRVSGGTAGQLADPQEIWKAFLENRQETEAPLVAREPKHTAAKAQETVDSLNSILASAGFYVAEEKLIEISPDVVSSWLTVTPQNDADGWDIQVSDKLVAERLATLPEEVNRTAVSGENIVNSRGDVLETVSPSGDGYELKTTEGLEAQVKDAVLAGSGVFPIQAEKVPAQPRTVLRELEVDLSEQKLYMKENGEVVNTLAISSGTDATPTPTGRFAVFAHVRIQDMGCISSYSYCTKDVPWVVYFAPDIAFHGAYWHNNFGHQMSHGCVNLPVDQAKMIYEWTTKGTEVWVHE